MSRYSRYGVLVFVLLCVATSRAAARHQAVEPKDAGSIARISVADFQKLYDTGAVLVVDVRDELSFSAGHIPGAIAVPLPNVERRAKDIKSKAGTKPVVTYCSCPAEHTSAEAGWLLYQHGVKDVRALVGGYVEWVRGGGRIEK